MRNFVDQRRASRSTTPLFGTQEVKTRVYHVLPKEEPMLDIVALLRETEAEENGTAWQNQEAWVL